MPEVFFGPGKASAQQIYLKENPGFDAVIANPPYISFGLGRVDTLSSSEEQFIRANFISAEYKISIYGLFVECGLNKIRPGGAIGMILPDSFMQGMYFSKLRELLLSQSGIERLIVFRKDFWESGDVGFPTILISQKLTTKDENWNYYATRCDLPEDLAYVEERLIQGSQIEFWKNERYRFILLKSTALHYLIEKAKFRGISAFNLSLACIMVFVLRLGEMK